MKFFLGKLHTNLYMQAYPKHTNISDGDDTVLWQSFKNGDSAAYATIYKKHADPLLKYGIHLCADLNLVEDAIHDLFVDLWEKRKQLKEVKSLGIYLKVSLRRSIFRKLKKNKIISSEELVHQNAFKFSLQSEDLKREMESYEAIENQLIKALNELSPRQREIIYLRFYQNMSYEEIAKHLSLDTSYTYNITSKAYSKLKKYLASDISLLILLASTFQ